MGKKRAASHSNDASSESAQKKICSQEESKAHIEQLWRLFHEIVHHQDKDACAKLFSFACLDDEPMAKAIAAVCYCTTCITVVMYNRVAAEMLVSMCSVWLHESVKKGCKYALFLKSKFVYNGICFRKDTAEAETLCMMSARQGFLPAQLSVGHFAMREGNNEARKQLELAGVAGCSTSQLNLGVLCVKNCDYIAAALWFQKAADHKIPNAMWELAKLYNKGLGVTKDLSRVCQLLSEAATAGHSEAKNALLSMTNTLENRLEYMQTKFYSFYD
jgi:TPR repeat protein